MQQPTTPGAGPPSPIGTGADAPPHNRTLNNSSTAVCAFFLTTRPRVYGMQAHHCTALHYLVYNDALQRTLRYPLTQDLPSLVWHAQLALAWTMKVAPTAASATMAAITPHATALGLPLRRTSRFKYVLAASRQNCALL